MKVDHSMKTEQVTITCIIPAPRHIASHRSSVARVHAFIWRKSQIPQQNSGWPLELEPWTWTEAPTQPRSYSGEGLLQVPSWAKMTDNGDVRAEGCFHNDASAREPALHLTSWLHTMRRETKMQQLHRQAFNTCTHNFHSPRCNYYYFLMLLWSYCISFLLYQHIEFIELIF